MKVHTHSLRLLHKWIGLIIGLQFLLWTLSGAGMALIDMDQVDGGARRESAPVQLGTTDGWPRVQAELAGTTVNSADATKRRRG